MGLLNKLIQRQADRKSNIITALTHSLLKSAVGTQDSLWLILGAVPSPQHGSGCRGDSGSSIFPDSSGELGDTVVAVHTGGYRMGYMNRLCGRITSLNHRVDVPVVLDWLAQFID
jgi:hypothetical protein